MTIVVALLDNMISKWSMPTIIESSFFQPKEVELLNSKIKDHPGNGAKYLSRFYFFIGISFSLV
jgi:hypothetical protein